MIQYDVIELLNAIQKAEIHVFDLYKTATNTANTALTTEQRSILDLSREEVADHLCIIASIISSVTGTPAAENDWQNRPLVVTEKVGDVRYNKISTDVLSNTTKYNIDVQVNQQDDSDMKIFADLADAAQKLEIAQNNLDAINIISYGDGHLKLDVSVNNTASMSNIRSFLQRMITELLNDVPGLEPVKYTIL